MVAALFHVVSPKKAYGPMLQGHHKITALDSGEFRVGPVSRLCNAGSSSALAAAINLLLHPAVFGYYSNAGLRQISHRASLPASSIAMVADVLLGTCKFVSQCV